MSSSTPQSSGAPAPAIGSALSLGSLGVALGFAVAVTLLFNTFFVTPFWVLLGRSLFVSALLLGVFVASQRLPQRWIPSWLPRWLVAVLAIMLVAPLASLLVYAVSVRGNMLAFVNNEGAIAGFFVYALTALLLGLVLTLTAQLRQQEAQARALALQLALEHSQRERQATDARLALLQAQIEPHFLFNTLANVQALVDHNSPRAAEVLKSLIAYLRATLPRLNAEQATLADEVSLVRSYLALMQMRMPDRLQFSIDVDATLLPQRFPPMALLTLVENAVRHGIDPSEEGGRIDVVGQQQAQSMHLWVADTGVGMQPQAQAGTGLNNLRERLLAFFGPTAQLQMQEQSPHGLRAEIIVKL